jgi:uncharacterized protein (UPF0332 family)
MADELAARVYREKAHEHLAAAESEYEQQRYNACAKLVYYACFHAAAAALIDAGTPLPSDGKLWSHAFVQSEFSRALIHQRHQFASQYQDVLPRAFSLRQLADYSIEQVSQTRAQRMLRRTQEFIAIIDAGRGGER